MHKVVVVGSINQDIVFKLSEIPKAGQTLLADNSLFMYGGKGANQAVSCSKLGVSCALIGKVGDDSFGLDYLDNLTKVNVDISGVIVSETEKTGVAAICVDKNAQNAIVVAQNANGTLSKQEVFKNTKLIENAEYILVQNEIPCSINFEIITNTDKKLIYDPAPARKIEKKYLKNIFALTPNEEEVKEVLAEDDLSVYEVGLKLSQLGVVHVLITRGEKGVWYFYKNKGYSYPAYKISPVDTTGAGDTFNGALAAYLAKGYKMSDAISYAQGAAALSTQKVGAQSAMPEEEELKSFIADYGVIKGQIIKNNGGNDE
ncbi:MAG: ribokinase [Clostridia bacterium]